MAQPIPSESSGVAVMNEPQTTFSYTPFTFTGEAPRSMDPVAEPTPTEAAVAEEMASYAKSALKENHLRAEIANAKREHAPLSVRLSAMAELLSTEIEREIGNAVILFQRGQRGFVEDNATRRFHGRFPSYAEKGEAPVAEFLCKVVNNNIRHPAYEGHLQITPQRLLFIAHSAATFEIEIERITSVCPAISLQRTGGGPDLVTGLPEADIAPTAIQIYTKEGQLHEFTHFRSLGDVHAALNWIDHALRGRLVRHSMDIPTAPGTKFAAEAAVDSASADTRLIEPEPRNV